jgi:hypothetical protein
VLVEKSERMVSRSHTIADHRRVHFERRLCRRNLLLGEVPEGAVEAPSG